MDFTKASIINNFLKNENHELSWSELAELYNILNGTTRAIQLANIIADLINEGIIQRQPLVVWKITDVDKAIGERDKLIEQASESSEVFKKGLRIHQSNFFWTIILAILIIVIYVLIVRGVI